MVVSEPGDPEVLRVDTVPDATPAAGEVLVKVAATAVNRADCMQRQGNYPPPRGASPYLGLECSGTVAEIGDDVAGWNVGDEVCALLSGGGYAELVAVPVGQLMPVPSGLSLVEAAALPEVSCTVWSMVFGAESGRLQPGERLLVHGGTSGIGTMAIQLAAQRGSQVIATAGTQRKAAFCRELGAELAINYRDEVFDDRVLEHTGKAGVDVVLDNMGGSYLPRNVRCLATGGRLVVLGLQGGRKGELDLGALLTKRATVYAAGLRARPAAQQALTKAKKKSAGTGTGGGAKRRKGAVQPWSDFAGADSLDGVYEVDQSPIGKTSRSTPATYVGVLDDIRLLFAQLPLSRIRGYTSSRFSFNNEGGRCESCLGQGVIKHEMSFLPTSYVPCEDCGGLRFNAQTLEVQYNDLSIGQVLQLTIEQASEFFAAVSKIHRPLSLLTETGLGYLRLGQPSPTLSGGEAQRMKLVTELTRGVGAADHAKLRQRKALKSTLYLLEEPTVGLHMADVEQLLKVLHRLVDEGNTVVVIEHHLSIIAEADYLVDIGPEAGDAGGKLVTAGTPW